MKLDIKILKIMYAIFFLFGFLLFFHYTNKNEVNIEIPNFTYDISEIEEEPTSIRYNVVIKEKYSDETLTKICEEIKQDYNHLYNLDDVNDKVDEFEIIFHYDNEVYRVITNNKED